MRVVILGLGFGGIYAYKYLRKNKGLDITLIDRNTYFLFTPLLHEVATGSLEANLVVTSVRSIIGKNHAKFINTNVESIDLDKKEILSAKGKINYDYLVLSTGSMPDTFGVNGVKANTYSIKTLDEAKRLKNQILHVFEDASCNESNKKLLLSFVIVGGGATGVELAAELSEYAYGTLLHHYKNINEEDIKITLVSRSKELVENFPKKTRRIILSRMRKLKIDVLLDKSVSEVFENSVKLTTGEKVEGSTIIWAAGVKPCIPKFHQKVELDKEDRVVTNEFLQIPNYQDVFVIGDVSSKGTMDAQIAVKQAKAAAENIVRLNGNLLPVAYQYKKAGQLLSLGKKHAAGSINGFGVSGFYVWFIWRTVYLFKMISFRKQSSVALSWTVNLFAKRDISKL